MNKRMIVLIALVAAVFAVPASAETLEMRGQIFDPAVDASPHTWTPQNFAGFYYDGDANLQSEELSATVTDPNTIEDGDLTYTASRVKTSYKNDEIGDYFVIGWFAEKYMAVNGKPDVLSKIVLEMNSTDKKTLAVGETWTIGNGYALIAKQIDLDGNKVWLSLEKNGVEVESSIVEPGTFGDTLNDAMTITGTLGAYCVVREDIMTTNTFIDQKDIGSEDDVPVFSCYVDTVFRDATTSYVEIKYAILIDDELIEIESDDEFGKLKVGAIGDESVQLVNDGDISLSRDSDIDLAGDMKFHVADDKTGNGVDNYRYYLAIDKTEPGTYEIRGQVCDPAIDASPHNWNPQNFAGFYYDVDKDLQSEGLSAVVTAPNTIDDGDLTYTASRVKTSYKNCEIGDYFIISWFGEKQMAVNGKPDVLSTIVFEMGSTDKQTLVVGEPFDLGNGYALNATSVNTDCDTVRLALEKDGAEVAYSFIEPGESGDTLNGAMMGITGIKGNYVATKTDRTTLNTFVYQADIGSEADVPVFSCYVDFVFCDATTSYVEIKYAILIDDELIEIESDSEFGKLEVGQINDEFVQLVNDGYISLSRDSDIDLAGDMKFHVADNKAPGDTADNYRYYPYVECTIGGGGGGGTYPPGWGCINDTDGDGVPDVWDMDNSTPSGYWVNPQGIGRRWGDMNGDGKLTSVDALMILQASVGAIDL